MTRLISAPAMLAIGMIVAASAFAQQFSVQTNAVSNIAGGSGTATYNGTTATTASFPGSGSISITNAPNTPKLTQATGQVIFTYPVTGGTVTGTAFASANLASGTLGAQGNGNQIAGTVTNEGVTTSMKDTLTFNIPGANSTTVTNIAVSFRVTGGATATGTAYAFGRTSGMGVGNAVITEGYSTSDNIIEDGGWASMDIASLTENVVLFNGMYALTGPNPTVPVSLFLNIQCQSGNCDFSHTGAFTMALPTGVTYTSASGVFLSQPPPVCSYTLGSGGMGFSGAGGTASISVAAPAGCAWSITGNPSWITFPGASSGSGNGGVAYQVQANAGADRAATLSVGGVPFVVEQQATAVTGLSLVGSMPHLAAEGGWLTTFTLVNKGSSSAIARTSFFGDGGNTLILPVNLPQQSSAAGSILASSLDQTIAPNATFLLQAAGPTNVPFVTGDAQLAATGSVDGFAIFHFDPSNQEAVVPMETRLAPSYLLAFDDTNGVQTGIALDNVSATTATVPMTIRNDLGLQVVTPAPTITIPPFGHFSCVLTVSPCNYPQVVNLRGTLEFDTPTGGQISALGIRFTPPGTLTTIPSLANVGNTGGAMAHLAVNGGWQTTFVLVNTGSAPGTATLRFYDDNGNPLLLPLTFPQGNLPPQGAPSLTETIPASASLWVQSTGIAVAPLQTGSAQLTTTGEISGYVIFRYNTNGQEAVVPLESRNASAYLIAFDNTQGATGLAISNASANSINVSVIFRDGTGALLGTGSVPLAPNGHTSFDLATQFPQTAGALGTAEFDTPAGSTISVLGIRSPPALTFTTLPALAK